MPIGELEAVISSIADYFNLPEQDKLLEASITINNQSDKPDERISKLILKGIDGSLTTNEIIDNINQYIEKADNQIQIKEEINKFIKIFTTSDSVLSSQEPEPVFIQEIAGPLDSKTQGTKDSPNLSVICLKNTKLTPANKETNSLTAFFNIIPTIEFTRAIPFLSVQVLTPRPPIDEDGRLNTLSSLKFLLGAEQTEEGTATRQMAEGLAIGDGSSLSGMELFTMPQTFVNADSNDDPTLRTTPIIDIFRPLLSLDKLQLKVSPQEGAISFKTGELYLTLHDRSRLTEIAELVKPDLFGKTELLIEYGWSHPDDDGTNVFGSLLNTMRVKEKFGVYNSSYEFDDVGQAKIKLDIAMKGATDFFNINISEGEAKIENAQKQVRKLVDEINELKQAVLKGKKNNRFAQRIRPLIILDTPSDLATAPDFKQIRRELRKLRSAVQRGSPKAGKELFDKLVELYGNDRGRSASRGAFGNLQRTVAEAIQNKIDLIARVETRRGQKRNFIRVKSTVGKDPFLDLNKTIDELEHLNQKKVSFGKLFLIFIGYPLVSAEKFDDIQLIFYNFNMHSGNMRNKNIAEFKFDVKRLIQKLKQISMKRQTADIPLWEFEEFITNNWIDDVGNEEYGVGDEFQWQKDDETGERKPIKKFEKQKGVAFERHEIIDGLELSDGIFKLPIIDIHVETTPGTSLLEGENPDSKNDKSILKIHIFDRQNSPYETQQSLLLAARTDSVETLAKDIAKLKDDSNSHKKEFVKYLNIAQELEIIEPFEEKEVEQGEEKVIQIKGGPRKLKEFLYETTPYITYAGQNTAILNLGYKTLYDAELVTINLGRSAREGNLEPPGVEQNNMPLLMMPGEMNVSSLGCPVLNFMQQFFVDVQTGTDVDNLYSIGELSHTIEPGHFESNFRLFPNDGYTRFRSFTQNVGVILRQLASKAEEG